ncbi:unnamed protein product [Rotaria sordida]|uniref:MULE transposase domain-containing protein n=1 Tax=Rotaria sordida TaxID=392033 RepID=A0A815E797_9BILA|nr:unnamed protein product [Rotaria sordida]CAF1580387.1 unnamed protein product [Rotaria sordida]
MMEQLFQLIHYPNELLNEEEKKIPLPTPTSFSNICIPDELKITNGGSRFLLYDNQHTENRIIILSSDDDLDRLSNFDHWHNDGTFKLYTIHGFICGRSLSSDYCIISGKSEHLYGEVFDVILQHVSGRPKSITIDFEKAVTNVIKHKLPTTTNLGLQQLFNDNSEVRRYLKTFGCLSLIPEPSVTAEFEKIQADSPDSINGIKFFYH